MARTLAVAAMSLLAMRASALKCAAEFEKVVVTRDAKLCGLAESGSWASRTGGGRGGIVGEASTMGGSRIRLTGSPCAGGTAIEWFRVRNEGPQRAKCKLTEDSKWKATERPFELELTAAARGTYCGKQPNISVDFKLETSCGNSAQGVTGSCVDDDATLQKVSGSKTTCKQVKANGACNTVTANKNYRLIKCAEDAKCAGTTADRACGCSCPTPANQGGKQTETQQCAHATRIATQLAAQAVELHKMLANRECVVGYYEDADGVCKSSVPLVSPVFKLTPKGCVGRDPRYQGEQITCDFEGKIVDVPGPFASAPSIRGMHFASDDAMVLVNNDQSDQDARKVGRGRVGLSLWNPRTKSSQWTIDCFVKAPFPRQTTGSLRAGQTIENATRRHTLAQGTSDTQISLSPDKAVTWHEQEITQKVGSIPTTKEGPRSNRKDLNQTYSTGFTQGSSMLLGSFAAAGGDAGASVSKRFHSAGFDMSTLSDGWHRLTARCDGKASYFYVDTKLVGKGHASSSEVFAIGNQVAGGEPFGTIAQFAVYDWAVPIDRLPQGPDKLNGFMGKTRRQLEAEAPSE